MSVVIKNMLMPYGCANCCFCGEPVYDSRGYATYFCNVPGEHDRPTNEVTDEVITMWMGGIMKGLSPDWCPLEERESGRWEIKAENNYIGYHCTECDYVLKAHKSNFCPNCGADMRKSNEANRW